MGRGCSVTYVIIALAVSAAFALMASLVALRRDE